MNKKYTKGNKESWSGRVDSLDDYSQYRWHQVIQAIDLNDPNQAFQGFGFAFVGFESDLGIKLNKGRTGAAQGPKSIRKAMASFPCQFPKEVKLFDAGNIRSANRSLNQAQDALAQAVEKILDLNLLPIVLGGGHETAFGHYSGLLSSLEKEGRETRIGIINFDAHFDFRPYKDDSGNSGTMFRQIKDLNESKNLPYAYMPLGIQKHSNTLSLFEYARENQVDYVLAEEIKSYDLDPVKDRISSFATEVDQLYISICTDVFAAAYAPGVSAPQAVGLVPSQVLPLIHHIVDTGKVLAFDIAEVSPRLDRDGITSALAATLIYNYVSAQIEKLGLDL